MPCGFGGWVSVPVFDDGTPDEVAAGLFLAGGRCGSAAVAGLFLIFAVDCTGEQSLPGNDDGARSLDLDGARPPVGAQPPGDDFDGARPPVGFKGITISILLEQKELVTNCVLNPAPGARWWQRPPPPPPPGWLEE